MKGVSQGIVEFLHTPKLLCISLHSTFVAGRPTRLLTEVRVQVPEIKSCGRPFPPRARRPESTARWVYIGKTSQNGSTIHESGVTPEPPPPESGTTRQSPSTGWLGNLQPASLFI